MDPDPNMPPIPIVHLCNALNGHISSCDCWCEPVEIKWYKNKFGVNILVVLHEDITLKHREIQLAERRAGIPAELHWIDRIMDGALDYPIAAHRDIPAIRQLPPHQEF